MNAPARTKRKSHRRTIRRRTPLRSPVRARGRRRQRKRRVGGAGAALGAVKAAGVAMMVMVGMWNAWRTLKNHQQSTPQTDDVDNQNTFSPPKEPPIQPKTSKNIPLTPRDKERLKRQKLTAKIRENPSNPDYKYILDIRTRETGNLKITIDNDIFHPYTTDSLYIRIGEEINKELKTLTQTFKEKYTDNLNKLTSFSLYVNDDNDVGVGGIDDNDNNYISENTLKKIELESDMIIVSSLTGNLKIYIPLHSVVLQRPITTSNEITSIIFKNSLATYTFSSTTINSSEIKKAIEDLDDHILKPIYELHTKHARIKDLLNPWEE